MYKCECCDLDRCSAKLPGIGYWCEDCISVCYQDYMDNCNPYIHDYNSEWRRLILHQLLSANWP